VAIVCFVLSTSISACGVSLRETELNPAPRPLIAKKRASDLEVYTVNAPTRPYVVVSLIAAEAESSLNTDPVIPELRAKAAAKGCDGLILGSQTGRLVGSTVMIGVLNGYEASCIVFVDEAASLSAQFSSEAAAPSVDCKLNRQVATCHRDGEAYETGNGKPKDLALAEWHYRQACELGSKIDCVRAKMMLAKLGL
jgi:hypothetical protein